MAQQVLGESPQSGRTQPSSPPRKSKATKSVKGVSEYCLQGWDGRSKRQSWPSCRHPYPPVTRRHAHACARTHTRMHTRQALAAAASGLTGGTEACKSGQCPGRRLRHSLGGGFSFPERKAHHALATVSPRSGLPFPPHGSLRSPLQTNKLLVCTSPALPTPDPPNDTAPTVLGPWGCRTGCHKQGFQHLVLPKDQCRPGEGVEKGESQQEPGLRWGRGTRALGVGTVHVLTCSRMSIFTRSENACVHMNTYRHSPPTHM